MATPRMRKDRPCDACRRRKTRCHPTSDVNACVLCQARDQQCSFLQDPPRKKRRAEREASVAVAVKSPMTGTSLDTNTVPVDYNNLTGPSLLKGTLGHQNRQCTSYLGRTQALDTQLLESLKFDGADEDINQLGRFRRLGSIHSTQRTYFIIKPDSRQDLASEVLSLDTIEAVVSPHGPALVDIYFRIVHPSFPILHKKVFLEKHGRSYRELTPLGLIAVYILSLNWWSYSLELASHQKPDVARLEGMVPSLLAACYRQPKISDLQAGLVLSQLHRHESWTLTAQLQAMAQNLGIHDDCSAWSIPDWERGVRKRVAWALFAQDKWGALLHGRPSHISESNWGVQHLNVNDFPETAVDDDEGEGSAEVEKGRLIFTNLILLTEILADILDNFFTLKHSKMTLALQDALEKAKPLQIRLKAWYAKLPSQLSMEESKARKLSSSGYLHLAYLALEVTLHRAILHSTNGCTDINLIHITRTAAMVRLSSAVEFLKRLRPHHLQSFWHFSSKTNLALIGGFGKVLCATSTSLEEAETCNSRLAEYLWTLRINSNGADFMKHAVEFLDAVMTFADTRVARHGLDSSTKIAHTTPDKIPFQLNEQQTRINGRNSPSDEFGWDTTSYRDHVSQATDTSWYPEYDIGLDNNDFDVR